jgi:hypothetical protein
MEQECLNVLAVLGIHNDVIVDTPRHDQNVTEHLCITEKLKRAVS